MIEKMKFITVTGPKGDIDRAVNKYITKYDIHLENALSELNTVSGLKPFVEVNPYKTDLLKAKDLLLLTQTSTNSSDSVTTRDEANSIIDNLSEKVDEINSQISVALTNVNKQQELLNYIEPFRQFDYDIATIFHFKFIKYRFGRIEHEHYSKFSKYVLENLNTIFYECDSDEKYIWGVYFTPRSLCTKIDAIYTSLHFERIFIPDEFNGTPNEAFNEISVSLEDAKNQLSLLNQQLKDYLTDNLQSVLLAYNTLESLSRNFDVRKMAACTKENQQVFYILCGWIAEDDYKLFEKDIADDEDIFFYSDDEKSITSCKPPTKLKNPAIIRPFEMFVNMYSLPKYGEIDPTLFLAITYSIIFGIMFGDAGQGAVVAILGFILYKTKHMQLGAILTLAGCCSVIFGLLYGSFFGFEEVIPALWMKPMNDVMTTLIIGVVIGVGLIFVAMILNMINALKLKDYGRFFFDTNGLSGFVFYGAVITGVLLVYSGKTISGISILVVFIVLPLILIFLKEPLTKMIKKKKPYIEGNKGMFFVEAFFELFEILLSFVTNTISFVRVGAFALSHAGMMSVVLMLGSVESGGYNWLIIVLGNILVMGLEGLIVGIQVLRLEYYEMFSRFYTGNGRPFVSYRNKPTA